MDLVNQGCLNDEVITATQATLDFESEGFDDWYLPSIDELEEMYHSIGNGGFSKRKYWRVYL